MPTMDKKDIAFLRSLTEAPSPSGYEMPAAAVLRDRLQGTADTIETNCMGSVHATLKSTAEGAPSLMMAGHIDEVGMMVTYISDEGFISFDMIGGIDAAILPGMRVDVHTKEGILRGVMGRKPIHLIQQEDRKTVTPIDKLFIDVGLDGEACKEKVRIGDAITYGVGFEEYGDGFAVARAFDDKLGVFIAVRVMEEVKKAGGCKLDLTVAGTVQEEIGLRGGTTSAYGVNPDIGICLEVGHATDYPDIDKRKYGEATCGGGPLIGRGPNINPVLFELLCKAGDDAGVPYQIGPENKATGTDANAIQLSRGGKVTALISIPLRYMHTPTEVLKLEDLDHTIALLTRFILDLDPETDFTPML